MHAAPGIARGLGRLTKRGFGRVPPLVLLAAWVLTAAAGACADSHAAASAPTQEVAVVETSLGSFEITLRPDAAPKTVANFRRHVEAGFYEGLIFHRIAWGFVIQGGGYEADGTYRQPLATVVNESVGGLPNTITSVAMARQQHPDSADSQFYVNLRNSPHLDAMRLRPGYTVFGHVTAGWDVVQAIAMGETRAAGDTWPLEPVVIRAIRIERRPSA